MNTPNRLQIFATSLIVAASLGAAPMMELSEDAQLHFIGDLSFVYEDNLFSTSVDKEDDTYIVFSPGVELRLAAEGSASVTIRYQHDFTRFSDHDELDADFANMDLSIRYDSGVVLARAYTSYRELYSKTWSIDGISDDLFGVLIKRDELKVGANAKYELSELRAISVGLDYDELKYSGQYIDQETISVPVTYFYQIRPNVDLTAGFRYRETDTNTDISYTDKYFFVGAVGELFSPVIFANVSVGYQDRNADGNRADISSTSYDLRLTYAGNPKSSLYAALTRDFRTSAFNGLAYSYSSASIGGNYQVSRNFSLNGAIAYAETDYEESFRAEAIRMARLGASYRPNDYLTVNVSYAYRDVNGDRPNSFNPFIGYANYSENEIRVTASLRY